jgi:hypothetical protein
MLSPTWRSGTTAATVLLAHVCSFTQEMLTVLTYIGDRRTLPDCVGLGNALQDRTRSIDQIARLIETNNISPEELLQFTYKADTNLYLMDTVSNLLTKDESALVQVHVTSQIPCDLSICDCNLELYDKYTQTLLENTDAVCFVIEPDATSMEQLKLWKESDYWPKDKKIFLLVNKYSETIAPLRTIARDVGIRFRDVCKLHYNPYIANRVNNKALLDIVPKVAGKDIKTIQLANDMKEIAGWITSVTERKLKWEG